MFGVRTEYDTDTLFAAQANYDEEPSPPGAALMLGLRTEYD